MKERLELILEKYGLTASKLAEILNVQRSGISHILAGRNKPSFDFLVSLLEAFPDIDANWLLTGEGEMIAGETKPGKSTGNSGVIQQVPDGKDILNQEIRQDRETISTATRSIDTPKPPEKGQSNEVYKSKQEDSRDVEGVFILYTDGTFRRYRSE